MWIVSLKVTGAIVEEWGCSGSSFSCSTKGAGYFKKEFTQEMKRSFESFFVNDNT
ncbi:hypothetical protein [Bacillus sp. X1(2014)]|uniref:hypothetical protein n=1 Tax=Bacillus sp. X1(2014) TaxID=1565991 RepID=UPI001C9313A3|nr:hypothetical protein [Bacillus sp. X1(2014)]